MKQIIKKYGLEKTKDDVAYDYKIYLKNLDTKWYLKIEKPTRTCKFYSVFTRFENKESFKKLKEIFNFNEFSGKFNHFVYDMESIENIINNVVMFDKLRKEV